MHVVTTYEEEKSIKLYGPNSSDISIIHFIRSEMSDGRLLSFRFCFIRIHKNKMSDLPKTFYAILYIHTHIYILNKYIEATAAGNGPETEQKPNLLEHRRK